MWVVRVERGVIRISLADYFTHPDDRRGRGAGVIEQHRVAQLHAVAHEGSRSVVANAVPVSCPLRSRHQVIERKRPWLGLHQPVAFLSALSWQEDPIPRTAFAFLRLLSRGVRSPRALFVERHELRASLLDGLALAHFERFGGPGA